MATRKELTSYFPHDSNARNSDKLIRLRMRHKAAGYGVYFMILERLREEPEYTSVKDYNMIAFDLREDASLIKSVVEDFGLFVFTDDGKYFYSESFKQRMEIKDEQSRKKAEAGKKGLEKRWGNSKNIANAIENDSKAIANATGNDSNKRKEKESKEKESKEKESKEKYPPPLSPTGGNGGCGNNLFSKDSNTDGIERNFEGLTNRLNRLFIPPDEFNIICQLSNNGEIGHPIWTIIQAAERGRSSVALSRQIYYFRTQKSNQEMKINVFKTQCKIGSSVKYKQKTRKVVDINRSTNEVCLDRRLWVRCTEVELLTSE